MSTKSLIIAVAIAILFTASSAAFTVDETEHAIITQFGEYKRTISEPGLKFKTPFVEQVTRIDRRILASDAAPEEYLTLDKKRLVADPITRWQVSNPIEFFKSVGDETRARKRIDDLVLSELRQELAIYNFGDIVGNARGPLMEKVTMRSREKAKEFGIEIVDVRIKRADLPSQVQQSVYSRMREERGRIAKQYRAEGQEESDKITAEADKEAKILEAKAYNASQTLLGEGDAVATRIYAEAFGKDPEFYAFLRHLRTYEQAITEDSTLVLSTDSSLFKYLTSSGHAK